MFIKDPKKINSEYCFRLAKVILANQENFFSKENEADAWCDFETWPDKKSDRNHLIMPGEVCLIDRVWNDVHSYVICQFYGNGRKVRDLYFVIAVGDLNRNYWKNGYFLLPEIVNIKI